MKGENHCAGSSEVVLRGEQFYYLRFAPQRSVHFRSIQPLGGARHVLVVHHRKELCQGEWIRRQQVEQVVQTLRTRRLGISKSLRQKPRVTVVERPELHRVALPVPCSGVSRRDDGMSNCRRKVLANQIEVRGVIEDEETARSSEPFVDACDELFDVVVRGNLEAFCELQEGGGEALPRVRMDPEGVVVVALVFEAIEHLYRELSLSDAARADDRLDHDGLAGRRESVEEFAEFLLSAGEVGNDVRRGQKPVLLRSRLRGSLASERIAGGRGFSVSAAEEPETSHVDEPLHASLSIGEDVDAVTQNTLRKVGQASRRFLRIGETLAAQRNHGTPRELSSAFQNPCCKPLSLSKDLHEAVSLDLDLTDLFGVSLRNNCKPERDNEHRTSARDMGEVRQLSHSA